MFSSNPFPQHPSSTNGFSPPNSFFYHEKDDVHYNSSIISGDFIIHPYNSSAPPPPALDREEQQYAEDHSDLLDSVVTPYKKTLTTLKKDGHSKIHTAQGPRDRRVRLSIDISRKLFCLQDLLGFDKASETLDWLFSKSLDAIKELVQETSCSSSTLTDQSKVTFLESINGLSVEEKAQKKKCVDGKKKKMMSRCNAGSQENLARAEARARARERTRQKLCIKNLDDELNTLLVPDDLKTFIPYSCESGLWGSGSRNFKAI